MTDQAKFPAGFTFDTGPGIVGIDPHPDGAELFRVGGPMAVQPGGDNVSLRHIQRPGQQYDVQMWTSAEPGFVDQAFIGIDHVNGVMLVNTSPLGWRIELHTQDIERVRIDNTRTATQTALMIDLNGVLKRVQVKAGNALVAGDSVMVLV